MSHNPAPHPLCAPPTPQPCPQTCAPPPPKPPCRVKPIMKRLHWTQTMTNLTRTFTLIAIACAAVTVVLKRPRRNTYKEYYARGEFMDYEDEMARKGLFQSVPKESLQDNLHTKK